MIKKISSSVQESIPVKEPKPHPATKQVRNKFLETGSQPKMPPRVENASQQVKIRKDNSPEHQHHRKKSESAQSPSNQAKVKP